MFKFETRLIPPALSSTAFSPLPPDVMTAARIAGLLLLLAAVATAVSVLTRLTSSMEPPEGAPVQFTIILSTGVYAIAGAARILAGLGLLAAAVFLRRTTSAWHRWADAATLLLGASGAVTAVSGACMLALAVEIPEAANGGTGPVVAPIVWEIPGWVEPMDAARWITGKIGFTLAGLGLIALAPVQWRIGGLLKVSAVADVIIGVAMLFIWVDAATVMHRVSGIAFLAWLIVSGLWLVAGRLKPPAPAIEQDDPQNATGEYEYGRPR